MSIKVRFFYTSSFVYRVSKKFRAQISSGDGARIGGGAAKQRFIARSCMLETRPCCATDWPATSWVHYTTNCNTKSSAPEDG